MTHRIGCISLLLFMAVCAGTVSSAADMELKAPSRVWFGFNGDPMYIPVTLTGSDAVLQLVVVESMRWDTPLWMKATPEKRFLQGLDPLVSVAPQVLTQEGDNEFTWNGRDMDGRIVPYGLYRYYLLAFAPDSVPDSLDYGIEHRSEIYQSASAMASGTIIESSEWPPVYPLVHFTEVIMTSVYARIDLSSGFGSSMEEPLTNGDEIAVFSPNGNLVGACDQFGRLFHPGCSGFTATIPRHPR